MAPLIESDYVLLKIDTERHLHGEEVAKRLRGSDAGGIPWTLVTDADGKALVSSDGPDGNIGCPMTPAERAWFVEMLRRTRTRLTDDELGRLEAALAAFAKADGR
ncbi:MAG: hypothetical protein R3F34_13885 [Planctomycetota bacterium]